MESRPSEIRALSKNLSSLRGNPRVPRPAGPRRALTLREIWRQLSRRPTMEVAAGRLMGAGRRGMMLSLLKPFVCDTQRLCPLLLT